MSETPSNVPYLAAPTHVARLRYLVAPAGLARPKELTVNIKIFIKND
jgi:hypothetical protein